MASVPVSQNFTGKGVSVHFWLKKNRECGFRAAPGLTHPGARAADTLLPLPSFLGLDESRRLKAMGVLGGLSQTEVLQELLCLDKPSRRTRASMKCLLKSVK